MLRSLRHIIGYGVHAADAHIGRINDIYFDDRSWTIRYIVVDIGRLIPDRLVLISPTKAELPDGTEDFIVVKLSSDEIRKSPGIETHLPVSVQEKVDLAKYYLWAPFWTPIGTAVGGEPFDRILLDHSAERDIPPGDPRLRSTIEIIGYHIKATDGTIGHVSDIICEARTWEIRYIVVDTRKLFRAGMKVIIAPNWVEKVDWANSTIELSLTTEQVRESPQYDASEPINRDYEDRLYDYYGRPKYWEEKK